jgi:hypothetical protein
MNREDIIRMAREAEWLHEYDSETGFVADAAFKFAALVASAEREACAKVCEDSFEYAGDTLAEAIRARKQA